MTAPAPSARAAGFVCLLLAVILLLAAFLRFFMLSEIGIQGNDTIYYLTVARGWIDFPEDRVPVILNLYALVLRFWGESDWSLKAFNASLDVFSVLLAFLIALRISGRRQVAVMTALAYALLPRAIAFARIELLHAPTTSFLLTSVACLAWYLTTATGTRGLVALGLSGLVAGLGTGVHNSVVPFLPGMTACVMLGALRSTPAGRSLRLRARTALGHTGLFVVSALVPMTPIGSWNSASSWLKSPPQPAGEAGPSAEAASEVASISYPDFFRHLLEFNTSTLVTFLFYALLVAAVALAVIAQLRPRNGRRIAASVRSTGFVGFVPAILIGSFLLTYPIFTPYLDPRHFLSGLPLVLMSIFLWMDQILGALLREGRSRTVLYTGAALAVIVVNSWSNPTRDEMTTKIAPEKRSLYRLSYAPTVPADPKQSADASQYPISPYRLVYNLLRDGVNDRNRVLVAPYALLSDGGIRRGFRHYFGENAVFVEDCTNSLEEFVATHRVRYIVFAGFDLSEPVRAAPCYGLREDQYAPEKEWVLLGEFLAGRRDPVKILAEDDRYFVFDLSENRP